MSAVRSGVIARPRRAPPAATTRPAAGTPARAVALVALVAAGAGLRLWQLGAQRLGFDEAFTAMTARRSLGSLFDFLRAADSHPPLSYVIRAPFAVSGVSNFWIRLPSATFSITALALFAWWMRRYGWAGVVATALMAVSAFQIVHGRDVRMYAEMELIGVAAVCVTDAWLRRPRRWHAATIGALVLVGLLTHVSMFLLGVGLLVVAGRRLDRDAWRWRVALSLGLVGWAVLWGPSFVVQAQSGHSDWIPRTSFSGAVAAVGQLATTVSAWHLGAVVLIVVGGVLLRRRGGVMARVWTCCFAIPVVCAAVAGLFAPVLLDRTLTVVSWGALFAIAIVVEAVARRAPRVGVVAAILIVAVGVPSAIRAVETRSTPNAVIRHLEAMIQPGDVVAVHPARRRPEIVWPLVISAGTRAQKVRVPALHGVAAIKIGKAAPSGRLWLLEWRKRSQRGAKLPSCAPPWHYGNARVFCLQLPANG